MAVLQFVFEQVLWCINSFKQELTTTLKKINWKKYLPIVLGIAFFISIALNSNALISTQHIEPLQALFDLAITTIVLTSVLIADIFVIVFDIALFKMAVKIYMDLSPKE